MLVHQIVILNNKSCLSFVKEVVHIPVYRLLVQTIFHMHFLSSKLQCVFRRVAEIQIFEKTYLIVIKDETGLKFKMNDSTLFLIGSYAQKLVASY